LLEKRRTTGRRARRILGFLGQPPRLPREYLAKPGTSLQDGHRRAEVSQRIVVAGDSGYLIERVIALYTE
jgi:hypothetical protein